MRQRRRPPIPVPAARALLALLFAVVALSTVTDLDPGVWARPAGQTLPAADYVVVDAVDGAAQSVATLDDATVVAAVGARITVLDVSEPADPRTVGRTPLLPAAPTDVAAAADTAFAALGAAGLAVIDVRDRANPHLAARLCLPSVPSDDATALGRPRPPASSLACGAGGGAPVRAVAVSGDGATVLAVTDDGLLVVDAGDPYWPRQTAWLPLTVTVRDVAALPGLGLVLGSVDDGDDRGNRLVFVDVREPTFPVVRSYVKLGGAAGAFTTLAAAANVAVAGGSAGAAVVDAARPDRPRVVARIDRFVAAVDVRSDGRRTWAALGLTTAFSGIVSRVFDDVAVFDVTAPASPRLAGARATVAEIGLSGIALGPVSAAPPWLVTTSALAGSTVLTLPAGGRRIVPAGEVPTGGASLVAVDDRGHALVVEGSTDGRSCCVQRLAVVDLDGTTTVGAVAGVTLVSDMAVAGDRAFLLETFQGLRIVSLAVPESPQTIGYMTNFAFEWRHVAARGRWIAAVDANNTVHVLDVGDPTRVRTLSAIPPPSNAPNNGEQSDVAIAGERLYVAQHDRLAAFDLTDPAQPQALGEALYDAEGADFFTPRVVANPTRAWVVDTDGGLVAFDTRAPLPRRLARFAEVTGGAVAEREGRALVALSGAAAPDGNVVAVVEAPLTGRGEGGVVGTWTTPGTAADVAVDPRAGGNSVLVASGAYGLTRWQTRDQAAPTTAPTAAPTRQAPVAPTRTARPIDPARAYRAFLPLVAVGANGPKAVAPLSLRVAMGGAVSSVAVDGPIGYVAEADRLVVLRLRRDGPPQGRPGPEVIGFGAVGERTVALATSGRRLAALVGPARALAESATFDGGSGGYPAPLVSGGSAGAAEPPPGDGIAVRLFDVDDPSRPRPAARVALPGGAADIAAGEDALAGWFAVVGSGADGGYLMMVDADDPVLPRTARLDLGPDVVPLGVALGGRRALVHLRREGGSAALLVNLDRPDRPAPGGTLGGLDAAAGKGGVAASASVAFVLTVGGVTGIDIAGRDPAIVSFTPLQFFGAQPAFITALGPGLWVGSRAGEVVQFVVIDNFPQAVGFENVSFMDSASLTRILDVGSGALLVGGGLAGGASIREAILFDPFTGESTDEPGEALVGQWGALGHCAAVGSDAATAANSLAFAARADGGLVALNVRTPNGGTAFAGGFDRGPSQVPLPPTGLALRNGLGALVGPLTRLRSLSVEGVIAVPLAEPPDTSNGGALDALRAGRTARRVVLADGFAWVAERNAGVAVYDVGDPQSLALVGRVETAGQPHGLAVRAGWVYVADGTAGLTVVDGRNPASPRETGYLATPGEVSAVALAADGRTAFAVVEAADGAWLGSGRDGAALWAVDVRSAASPRVIGSVGLGLSRAADVLLDGHRLYAAGLRGPAGAPLAPGGGAMAVVAVDVGDPARPAVVGRWDAPAGHPYAPSTLAKVGTRLVVAQGDGGLLVVETAP